MVFLRTLAKILFLPSGTGEPPLFAARTVYTEHADNTDLRFASIVEKKEKTPSNPRNPCTKDCKFGSSESRRVKQLTSSRSQL